MQSNTPQVAWLFPGQGSQDVGMGSKLLKGFEPASEILRVAESLAGRELRQLMLRGPDRELANTQVVQPAMVALSCGYIELLWSLGLAPGVVAGHSLGELSALYAARVLTLRDVLRLASVRGQLMSAGQVGGMIAVKNCDLETLEKVLSEIHDGIACLANLNAPSQLIVSGDEAGLQAVSHRVGQTGGETMRLNVSGAWHSPLVGVAAYEFSKELLAVNFSDPVCDVVMSSTGKIRQTGEQIKQAMLRQMTSPVRWYETIENLMLAGFREYYEVGSGKVLKGLMRRIVPLETPYKISTMEYGPMLGRLIKQANALETSHGDNP